MTKEKHIHCPMNGWDCPYYTENQCKINNPMAKCDIFAASTQDENNNYDLEGKQMAGAMYYITYGV